MKVHFLRSTEYSEDKFTDVLEFLYRFRGPLSFVESGHQVEFRPEELSPTPSHLEPHPDISGLPKKEAKQVPVNGEATRWANLFKKCREFRVEANLADSDFVVLLTEIGNEKNWFSSRDPGGNLDFFVQTSQWDRFLGSDQRFPVAYLVASEMLQSHLFLDHTDLLAHVHHRPRGCVFDFCENKEEITVPMRTADLCAECTELVQKRQVDTALVTQILAIMEDIRLQILFKERFQVTRQPSRLSILGSEKRLILDDLGDLELRLNPLEKTIFLFFLSHPEGVAFSELSDHREEILAIYESVSRALDRQTIHSRIDRLVAPGENMISENISRIRKKLIEAVGPQMIEVYAISGPNAGKKTIDLDRSLVRFDELHPET